jgi:hypothetical protein
MASEASGAFAEPIAAEDEARDEISQLEERIEALAGAIERCRKIALASRVVLAAGCLWAVLMLLGVLPFAPSNIISAIAALLGGIVLLGSNASTWTQAAAAMHKAESQRNQLIDAIALHVIRERPTLH